MSLCRDMMPHWELRAALDNAEAKVAEQAAEIERLRAALQRLRRNATPMMRGWIDAALEDRA